MSPPSDRKKPAPARKIGARGRARKPDPGAGRAKPAFDVSYELLRRMQTRRRQTQNAVPAFFAAPPPPPGVVPKNNPTLAMDQDIAAVTGWAQGALSPGLLQGLVHEGGTWESYPYLGLLAQRPEYRRVAEIIASEMTRKWIALSSRSETDDASERINRLKQAMERLNVHEQFRRIAVQEGLFGRAHLYVDLGTTDDPDELRTPIGNGRDKTTRAKVKKGSLQAFRTIEPVWAYPTMYNAIDPLKGDWYNPNEWFVMSKAIHRTRLLTFVGREVPDLLKPAYMFGGLSLSQMIKPYVDNWLRIRQSVSDLVSAFSFVVLKTNMQGWVQDGGDHLDRRLDLFNAMRDNRASMAIDKDTEELENLAVPLGSLDQLQAQAQEHMSSATGIPLVKLLGIQPAGLNASSEGEIRTFYDWIHAYQELLFRRHLQTVLDIIQLSEFGDVDEDIIFEFENLWQLDDAAEAAVQQTLASIHETYLGLGVIAPEEVREAVAADDKSPYAGLDLGDELPAPPMPEGEPQEQGQPEQQIQEPQRPGAIAPTTEYTERRSIQAGGYSPAKGGITSGV
jgi:phage-related protein (TIGR01555 family)